MALAIDIIAFTFDFLAPTNRASGWWPAAITRNKPNG
jgi:hypothetical protein